MPDQVEAEAAMLEAMNGGGWEALGGIPFKDAMAAHDCLAEPEDSR